MGEWIGLVLPLIAAGAATATQVAPPLIVTPAPAPNPLAIEPDVLALGDAETRMTVPVSIATRGPWPFIIDTGAERTVVSRQLAGVLGLAAGPQVRVTAMTGASDAGTVVVPSLAVSRLTHPAIEAPALESRHIGALGMLGLDALQGHRVSIDFDRNLMTVRPAEHRSVRTGAFGDDIVVVAKSIYGQLIVTDAHWRGERIAVILDTGSAMSVGNMAMLAAMRRASRALGLATMVSATGGELTTDTYAVDGLTIGGARLDNVPIAFADAAPFARFGLGRRAALMLGMDALKAFRRVEIDFANRDIRLTVPRASRRTAATSPVAQTGALAIRR